MRVFSYYDIACKLPRGRLQTLPGKSLAVISRYAGGETAVIESNYGREILEFAINSEYKPVKKQTNYYFWAAAMVAIVFLIFAARFNS